MRQQLDQIRPMHPKDIPKALRIEEAIYDAPWHYCHFFEELQHGRGWVYLKDDAIKGYIMATFVAEECDIHNLSVVPILHNNGIGQCLLLTLIKQARRQHIDEIFLDVRASNVAAQHLYKKFGFYQYGCRKGYYRGKQGSEDAWLFKLRVYS